MDTNFEVTLKYADHLLKYVKVNAYSENVYEGWLKDIDPLSGNLILVNFKGPGSKKASAILVQGRDCKSVEVVKEEENMKNSIQYFFNEGSPERVISLTKDIIELKKNLISWFKKNRLEVEESEDNIVVCNAVTIHPPYTPENCVSNNGRVLVMTKNLMSNMPGTSENSSDSDNDSETVIIEKDDL